MDINYYYYYSQPENIYVTKERSDFLKIKIGDFGWAKVIDSTRTDDPNAMDYEINHSKEIGTKLYWSPELVYMRSLKIC